MVFRAVNNGGYLPLAWRMGAGSAHRHAGPGHTAPADRFHVFFASAVPVGGSLTDSPGRSVCTRRR